MEIINFQNGQIWGILPEHLDGLANYFHENQSFIQTHMQEFEAAVRSRRSKDEPDYTVTENGVALIPIVGPIFKRETFFSFLFSGASIESITRNFKAALNDNAVKSIVFDIDSPGGTISGIDSLSSLIYNSRGEKPLLAFANGLMASAAYWIGSAAEVIVAEKTATVGSIGVMTVHYDFSKADDRYGLKRTYLSAGKYKTLGNDAEPLSTFAKEYFQDRLDYFYSMFVDTVAKNRDSEPKTVLKDMADGRLFIGKQAVNAGLIDDIGELGDVIFSASARTNKSSTLIKINAEGIEPDLQNVLNKIICNVRTKTVEKGGFKMKFKSVDQLVAAYPEFCQKIYDEGAASIKIDEVKSEAVTSEKKRIFALAAVMLGEEKSKKFEAIVESGITVEQFKTVAPEIVEGDSESEKEIKTQLLEALKTSGAATPGQDSSAATERGKDFLSLVEEYQAAHKTGKVAAMQAVMKTNPEAHEKYLQSVN